MKTTIIESKAAGRVVRLARFRTDIAGNSAYYWTTDEAACTDSKYDGFGGFSPKSDNWHYGARSKALAIKEAEATLKEWAAS